MWKVRCRDLGRWAFDRKVRTEVSALVGGARVASPEQVSESDIVALPEPVRRYLHYSGVLDRSAPSFVRLEHGGTFRTSPNQKWTPIEGVEYFTALPPGSLWYAVLEPAPPVTIRARDCYLHGQGNMLVKLLSLVPLSNERGPKLDQGALLRFLAETPWIPSALLPGGPMEWSVVDESSAQVTLRDGPTKVSAIFHLGSDGAITRVQAERFRSVEDGYELVPWGGTYRKYAEVGGIRVPMEVEVTWRLESGDFTYARFRVTKIAFDQFP